MGHTFIRETFILENFKYRPTNAFLCVTIILENTKIYKCFYPRDIYFGKYQIYKCFYPRDIYFIWRYLIQPVSS